MGGELLENVLLTSLENRILGYISDYIARHEQSPTIREIAGAMDISSRGTVHRYLLSLINKGQLQRQGRGWRSIRLSAKNQRSLTVLPLQGAIQTGKSVQPLPGKGEINFSAELLGPGRFALQVLDRGMVEDGILDGDYVVVRKTAEVNDDDIVVAIIDDGEVTLRRLRKHGDRIELIPANRKMLPLIYPTERVHIQGVVTGILRLY